MQQKNQPKTVYVYGFGTCFLADSMDDMPTQGFSMRYYGTEDGYNVYGTDTMGINKYTSWDSVEFWAIKR